MPMYFLVRVEKSSGRKWYWISGGKQGKSYWRPDKPGMFAFYEVKHAKAVLTRYGWKNTSFYSYHCEDSNDSATWVPI